MKTFATACGAAALATASFAALPAAADGHAVGVGVILGFTGPIESLTPDMAIAAELALAEATEGGVLGGKALVAVRADSTCVDAAAASAAAERLITSDGVVAIMGADCSGVTTAIANNVAVPNGVAMISPSATSPALSTIDDKGYFFRTAPSDARQGEVLAAILMDRGVSDIAVTYTNNDYGKGLSDAFAAAFEAAGGSISISAPHEDGKADYSAEVGALSASGSDMLAVFGYVDQGGKGIIQASLDTGAFDMFVLGDGMYGESLTESFGSDIDGTIGTVPGTDSAGATLLQEMLTGKAGDPLGPFTAESYDAAALIALAMQKAGSTDRAAIQAAILDVANGPGEEILPGEIGVGLAILAEGGSVDYVGATNVNLIGPGEAAGSYREYEVRGGAFETVRFR